MLKEYLNPDLSVVNLITIAVTFCSPFMSVCLGSKMVHPKRLFLSFQKNKINKSVNTLFLEYFVTLFNLFYQKC